MTWFRTYLHVVVILLAVVLLALADGTRLDNAVPAHGSTPVFADVTLSGGVPPAPVKVETRTLRLAGSAGIVASDAHFLRKLPAPVTQGRTVAGSVFVRPIFLDLLQLRR